MEGFAHSLRTAIDLDPENITVHTLTLKRASRIVMEDQEDNRYADVAAMLERCGPAGPGGLSALLSLPAEEHLQNLENVGWCKPGREGYYNIYIMEEVQTIPFGRRGGQHQAGGCRRPQDAAHLQFQVPNEYIQRFDQVLERKKRSVCVL